MKITVIYSNTRKESTYNCVQIFKKALGQQNDIDFTEFTLTKDFPYICLGCFNCIENGEEKCPHANYAQPIINAMLESDGIIISSPVFALNASSAIKSLFEHMCYLWLPHRPNEEMFDKIVMTISTTAGAGAKDCIKTLKKSPSFWGVKRIYSFGAIINASRWDNVSEKNKIKITQKLTKKATRFSNAIKNRRTLRPRLFVRFLFPLLGKMISKYEDNSLMQADKSYWKQKNWLSGGKPF